MDITNEVIQTSDGENFYLKNQADSNTIIGMLETSTSRYLFKSKDGILKGINGIYFPLDSRLYIPNLDGHRVTINYTITENKYDLPRLLNEKNFAETTVDFNNLFGETIKDKYEALLHKIQMEIYDKMYWINPIVVVTKDLLHILDTSPHFIPIQGNQDPINLCGSIGILKIYTTTASAKLGSGFYLAGISSSSHRKLKLTNYP